MKNIALAIMFALVVSGCVTGAKEVKPSSEKAVNTAPSIEEKNTGESATPTPVSIVKHVPYNPMPEPNKIQYSQITNLIREFIDIKDNSTISGENGYLGVSENKLAVLEIKGNKNDVREASMKLIYPKGIDKTSAELNNAMMYRFLKNIAPEFQDWQGRTKEILDKFHAMQTGVKIIGQEDIRLSNKVIQIRYDTNAEYIVVTLRTQP